MRPAAEFLAAVCRGDTATVTAALRTAPDLVHAADDRGKTPLHWAAERDDADLARVLIANGADIEAQTTWGATPLQWAATMGGRRVGALLLEHGAKGRNLITAAGLGDLDFVHATVESGANLTDHRRLGAPGAPNDHWPPDTALIKGDVLSDALYAAARNGHAAIVEYLLTKGADVNAKGVFGATATHWAAFNGHARVVALLIDRGARTDIRDDRFHATAAQWAAEKGHLAIANALSMD